MELETAVRRMLLAAPAVAGYVGQKVFKWRLDQSPQGTGGRALAVRRSGGWDVPDHTQSSEFPLLEVSCWADCDRDADGNKVVDNALDKAYALYRVVDPLLHRQRNVVWGAHGSTPGLLIVSSMRNSEPVHETEDDFHTQRADLSDCAVVRALYEVHTYH